MYLPELLKLVAAGPEKLQHVADLAVRLTAIDKERAAIIAELSEMGIGGTAAPEAAPIVMQMPLAPNVPLCETCGKEGTEQVDGDWYCETHGDAVVASRMKPAEE